MKHKLLLIAAILFLGIQSYAQPTAITWQGKLLDASGNAITQNNVAMTFAMFDASTAGNQLWPASGVVAKVVNIVNGLYSVQLGTGTGDDIAFTAAMFEGKTPWLEVKIGTETLPRTEITNVPFALISNDLSATGWENPGEIGKTNPNTGKFTSVETGNLKVTDGASDGKVLTSDADGNASWTTPYTGLANFTESNYTYNTKTGAKLIATDDETDVDLVLSSKGTGAIIAQQPDGTTAGGNNRGQHSVDLQMGRGDATHVASGYFSTIPGGINNTASGDYSTAMGSGSEASGPYSTAIGRNGKASGSNSTVLGFSNIGSGSFSTAIGSTTTASGLGSTAMGYLSIASNGYAIAMGYSPDATGIYSIAMGASALASNTYAIAIGNTPTASGYASLAMGDYTSASGKISTAMGNRTTAPSAYETVLGRYNADYTPASATDWIATDRLFVVGNGTSDVAKSNALTILKNANTTIGGSLTLNGNGTNASITLPTGRGSSGQFLKTDGAGATSWSGVTKSDVGLGNVENTTLSTWAGSTNITTVGTIATGAWSGTAITVAKGGTGATTKAAGFDALSPMTTAGDIIYGGTNGTGTRLAKGTASQILAMNTGATAPEWKSLSKSDVGLGNVENTALSTWAGSASITTLGIIATGTWSGTAVAVTKGGTGSTSKAAGFDALSPMNSQGDIIYGGTGGTGTRLGKGTAGQVLKMNAGATAPEWGSAVLSVSGTAPIISSGGTSPAISISEASTTSAGSMSATDKAKLDKFPNGTEKGEILFWNGSSWTALSPGDDGKILTIYEGVPVWTTNYYVNFLSIGDYYGGGVVAYILQSGDTGYDPAMKHGIIAATSDQASAAYYGVWNKTVGANATAIGTGKANTALIIANMGTQENVAANFCDTLTLNGYTDWFLPSLDELAKLYDNRSVIGGFSSAYYWSSTEAGNNYALVKHFGTGAQSSMTKWDSDRVRAIRYF